MRFFRRKIAFTLKLQMLVFSSKRKAFLKFDRILFDHILLSVPENKSCYHQTYIKFGINLDTSFLLNTSHQAFMSVLHSIRANGAPYGCKYIPTGI